MFFLDLTLPTPPENLALDEALLDQVAWAGLAVRSDGISHAGESLRIWEAPHHAVVLGASSRYRTEANVTACAADGVPIERRASGGAAIVAGPGCLMYAVTLSYAARPELRPIDAAHRFVQERLVAALAELCDDVAAAGTSDLIFRGRKFSGNALRCKRHALLYHGTLLYDFPLEYLPRYLGTPPRMPSYRSNRPHEDFVTNVPLLRRELIAVLCTAFAATEPLTTWPTAATARLTREKYETAEWRERL